MKTVAEIVPAYAVHTPGFVDYDAVERLTQLLILAAQRKRVVFYWQAVAACQGADLDQVIRGHIQPDKDAPPTNETLINVINHVAQVCKEKAWPPLTILITKDGKNVSTGFWTNSPLGDLSSMIDGTKRDIELHWRQDCFAFFDALSSLNSALSARIGAVYKAIKASQSQFPLLAEAFTAATTPVIDGVTCPLSLASIDALVRKGIILTSDQSAVLQYDDTVFVTVAPPEPSRVMVLLPVGEPRLDFIQRAFKQELQAGNLCISVIEFEILGVLSETQENLVFTAQKADVISGTSWNYSVQTVLDYLDPNIAGRTEALLAISVDPQRGTYAATSNNQRVTNIIARVTARIE